MTPSEARLARFLISSPSASSIIQRSEEIDNGNDSVSFLIKFINEDEEGMFEVFEIN